MKTIDEAVKEYKNKRALSNSGCEPDLSSYIPCVEYESENGFNAGVEFAQKWISVEDELPRAWETGDWDGRKSDTVLVKTKKGNIHIADLFHGIIDGSEFADFYSDNDYQLTDVTHWRLIELT
jgi:hypothetical protein